MKIKQDFVTNSSSTAFFFVFKGPKCVKSLTNAIWNHKESFNLHYSFDDEFDWHCNAQDIVEDIEKCVKDSLGRSSEWNAVKFVTLDEKIKDLDVIIEAEKKQYEQTKNESWAKYTLESIRNLEKIKRKLEGAKRRGFENFFEMEWGDNHGQVAGGNTGHCMDYNSGSIRIDADDLIVLKESKH